MTAIPATTMQLTPAATAPAGWVRLADVVATLGAELGIGIRQARNRVKQMPEQARRMIGGELWFDPRYMVAGRLVALAAPRPDEFDPTHWTGKSVQRDALLRRIVGDADEHAATRRREGVTLDQADREFVGLCGNGYYALGGHPLAFSERTLKRWRSTVRRGGNFAERRGRKSGSGSRQPGAKAVGFFLAVYKQPGQTLRRAWEMTAAKADHAPDDPAWSWPSEPTIRRWLNREHPPFFLDYYRKGSDAWRAGFEPKLNREPLELPGNCLWELDASKCNLARSWRTARMCSNGSSEKRCHDQARPTPTAGGRWSAAVQKP